MKIAVLSDLHGNIIAFEEAIKDAKSQGVEIFIVLGDIITDLPITDEIIDKVKELTPYVIKGNREQYLLQYEQTKEDKKWKTLQSKSVTCYYDHIREDNKGYIRNLPEQLKLEFEGVTIRAVHGSPYSITELLYFNTPLMNKVFSDLQEDILVYGHNHRVARYEERKGKIVLQVGTLGMHNNGIGIPQYSILECKNGKVNIEIRNVDYSREELKNKIKQVGGTYPEAKIWQNLCYQTLIHTEDIRKGFCHMAKDMMIEKYNGQLPQGFDSHFVSFDDDIYKEVSKKFEKYFIL